MFRKLILAAALAFGGFAAASTSAEAGDVLIGVGVAPAIYYGGGQYQAVDHRRWHEPRYRDRSRHRDGYRRHYRDRPYYGHRRPACRLVTVRRWNGYRYVTRTREECRRPRYSY